MPSKIALIFSLSFVLCSYFLRCLQRHRSKTHFVQWKRAVHLGFLLDSNENEGAGRFPFSRTLLMQHDVSCSLLLYLHFVVKETNWIWLAIAPPSFFCFFRLLLFLHTHISAAVVPPSFPSWQQLRPLALARHRNQICQRARVYLCVDVANIRQRRRV